MRHSGRVWGQHRLTTARRFVAVLTLGALAPLVHCGAASAATFTAGCSGGTGDVASLVAAINSANSSAGADTIELGAGCTYTLTAVDNYWYGPNGLPPIASAITIEGNGATLTRSPSAPTFRLLFVGANPASPSTAGYVSPGAGVLTLRGVTLSGGLAQGGAGNEGGGGAGMGGAIFSQGTVVIEASTLTGNEARGGSSGQFEGSYGGGGMGTNSVFSGGGFGPGSFGGPTGGAGGPGGGGGGGGAGFAEGENGLPAGAGTSGPGPGGGFASGLGGGGGDVAANAGDGSGGGGCAVGSPSTEPGGHGGAFGEGGEFVSMGGLEPGGGGGGVGGGGSDGECGGGGGFGGGGGDGFDGGNGGFGGGGGGFDTSGMGGTPGFGGGTPKGPFTGGGGGAGMGGALFNMQGQLAVIDSTLTANSALGGKDNAEDHAKGIGGAVFNLSGSFTATGSTFAANTAAFYASQIYNLVYDGHTERAAQTTLRDTIVAGAVGAVDLASNKSTAITPANLGSANADVSQFDLVRTMTAQEQGTITGSPLTTDPLLGPLAANGGPTATMALLEGSPAIDAGSSFGLAADQRADARPVDFSGLANASGGDGADIGAYELQQSCLLQALPFETCHTLTSTLAGSGSGTVTGPGIACPGTCSASYGASNTVTITALPRAGSTFTGWSGACSGTGACHVAMSTDRTVVASFTLASSAPPTLADVRQSHVRWREGPKLVQISKRRKRPPVGTVFTFTLNEQATVTLTFSQRRTGRRSGRRCVASTHRNTKHRRCARVVVVGALSLTGHSGVNHVAFEGRLSSRRRLRPGRYSLVVAATGTAGQRASSQPLRFTIVG